MKKIICENQQGKQIAFEYSGLPLALVDLDGFSNIEYAVNSSKSSGQDGETYNGETANKRNLVISAMLFGDFQAQRDILYDFFQPRTEGTVYHYEDDTGRKANYYVEKIDIAESGSKRPVMISLICPDPKFYDLEEEITQLATLKGRIIFPLFITDPFLVTERINTLIGNMANKSSVIQGITVKFLASGAVVNPSLYDVNRHEKMQIGTTGNPMTMHTGDQIVITTGTNNKRVLLTSGGITSNINNCMAYPPVWLQAYPGDNLFRYDAQSGIDSLSVSIHKTQAYWGA